MFDNLYSKVLSVHIRFNPVIFSLVITFALLLGSVASVEAAYCPAGGSGGTGC